MEIRSEPPPEEQLQPASLPGLQILAQSEQLLALAKPSGVPVIPDRSRTGGNGSCLAAALRLELDARPETDPRRWTRPRIVHRIDRLTSGLVLIARRPDAERQLGRAFEARGIQKEYRALLVGRVVPARWTVRAPIGPGRKGRQRVAVDGRSAETQFEVLDRFRDFTWTAARPRSGRMHQIRVHALLSGHPLAIDPLYRVGEHAAGPMPPEIDRLTLHSWCYRLPASVVAALGLEEAVFTCPISPDLASMLRALRTP